MLSIVQPILVFLFSYLVGSLPFSVWLGKLFLHRDVRKYGDGNPGTASVFRAGGKVLAVLVMLLDITKGVIPPLLVQKLLGGAPLDLFLAGVAPVLGHAFSPFLRFRGGKAVAVTFGTWIGLTTWQVPLVAVVTVLAGRFFLDSEGWALMLALTAMLISILLWQYPPVYPLIMIAQIIILAIKHRDFLNRPPRLHPRFHPGSA